ncbi:MAG: acyl-CoA dehydrogenase family protein [Granulosicoccus sp.]
MNFELSDEQRMLQDTLRRMLKENHDNVWSQLAQQGVFAALFSERDGGFGGSGFDLAVVFEEFGRAGTVEPVIESSLVCGGLIAELAFDSQRALLKRIVAGDVQLAFAHSEPASRYELNHVETRVEQHQLNGRKSVVINADAAEFILVSARSAGDVFDTSGIALYLVPANTAGVTMRTYEVTGGGRAADLVLDNVQLSSTECLSEDAFDAIESATASAIVALCAETLGAMETATSMTCEYLTTRQQFGLPLASFQALAHRVSEMLIELEQARSAVLLAAGHLHSDQHSRDLNISAAKNLLGRIGKLIAEESIQLHGGIGMTNEYQLGHFAKKIIMADHRYGDVDHHLERFVALSRPAI